MVELKILQEAAHAFAQRPLLALAIAACDFAFFWLYGFARMPLASQSAEAFTRLLAGRKQVVLSELLASEYFLPFLGSLLLVIVVLYLLFVFLQGMAFYCTHRLRCRIDWMTYVERFARASIFWGGAYVIFQGLAFAVDFIAATGGTIPSWTPYVYDLITLVLLYFAGIHYALLGKRDVPFRDALWKGRNCARDSVPLLLILYVISRGVDLVLPLLSMPLAIVLFLVWIMYTRNVWVTYHA